MRVVLDLVPGAGARRVLSDLSDPEWSLDPAALMHRLMPTLDGGDDAKPRSPLVFRERDVSRATAT